MQVQVAYSIWCSLMHILIGRSLAGPVTENSIISSNSIFSNRFPLNLPNHHHHQFGVDKPSRLRLYLLADLARAAAMQTKAHQNCESSVELKVGTRNCSCGNYACQQQRFYKSVKKPRIFERTCEDYCCSKQRFKGKSLLDNESDKKLLVTRSAVISPIISTIANTNPPLHSVNCGEIIPDNNNKLTIPWIVQIASEKQDRCIGSLLSSRAVITSENCIDKSDKIFVTRFSNETTKADNLLVKKVLRDDLVRNSIILVLEEPAIIPDRKLNPCLPQDEKSRSYPNCYLGLPNQQATPVKWLPQSECDKISSGSQATVNSNICVKYHYASEEHTGPGAPLLCSWDTKYPNNFQIVGVLSEKINDILIFDNINRIQNMIKSNLSLLV